MARLFTALWPPPPAVAELEAALRDEPDWLPDGWRRVEGRLWHVTLCFHGEAEPGVLARRLDGRADGLAAPWLRLAGALSWPRLAAVRVDPAREDDEAALRRLASAAGAEPDRFRAHVTVARAGRRAKARVAAPRRGWAGRWWQPTEVCLVRSELGAGPSRYTVAHRVPLRPGPDARPGGPGSAPPF